jgi:hypothetical protein
MSRFIIIKIALQSFLILDNSMTKFIIMFVHNRFKMNKKFNKSEYLSVVTLNFCQI